MKVIDRRSWPERTLESLDEAPNSFAAMLLTPLGYLYAFAARVRRLFLVPDRRLPSTPPSLGVGNLRVGGTGKTPLVEDLAARFVARDLKVVIVSRGYRAEGGGDEPRWFADKGHLVVLDPDRWRGFRAARAAEADVVLFDDSLQSRYRPRMTIAIELGRDQHRIPRCLPAGPAREGANGLDRASAQVVRLEVGDQLESGVGFRLSPQALVNAEGERQSLDALEAMGPCLAVSGLARPASFEADAVESGAQVIACWRGPDHWTPDSADAVELFRLCLEVGASFILCPEKNLQRVIQMGLEVPVIALASAVVWENGIDPLEELDLLRGLGLGD